MNKINPINTACYTNNVALHERLNPDVELYKNRDLGLVEIKDNRSVLVRVKYVVVAIFNSISALMVNVYKWYSARKIQFPEAVLIAEKIYSYPTEILPWSQSEESKGLYFFIHGFKDTPADWYFYMKEISQKEPEAHMFLARVPLEGNCDLETAGSPLLDVLKHYLTKFPGKPVSIIGTSNGGRLTAYLENYLDPSILGNSFLSTVSISGVHYGTKVIDLLKKIGLLPEVFMDKKLKEEFQYGSQKAEENLATWRQKQTVWKEGNQKVRHLFCATLEDEKVREPACALPYHQDAQSTYMVLSGQSHVSIVDAVRDDVFKWLGRS